MGRLNLETNGGSVTVMVRADVPVKPFPDGVLAGACSPREAAATDPDSAKLLLDTFANRRDLTAELATTGPDRYTGRLVSRRHYHPDRARPRYRTQEQSAE